MNRKKLINNTYIASVLFWSIAQMILFNGFDGGGRILMILSITTFLYNIIISNDFRKFIVLKKGPFFIWGLLVFHTIINTFINPIEGTDISYIAFMSKRVIVPYLFLSIVSSERQINLALIQYVLSSVLLIVFIVTPFSGPILYWTNLDPNEFILNASALTVIIGIRYFKGEINFWNVIIWLILPVFMMVITGSRMGFGTIFILTAGMFLVKTGKVNIKTIFLYIFIAVSFYFLTTELLKNTYLGERLLSTTEQGQELSYDFKGNYILEKFGDRGIFYAVGWDIFKKHPIWGIGLYNFRKYFYTACHVEYIVHLTELGIIGLILYILFNYSIFKSIKIKRRAKELDNKLNIYLYFVLGSILFAASALFLYHLFPVFLMYGLIINFTQPNYVSKFTQSKILRNKR